MIQKIPTSWEKEKPQPTNKFKTGIQKPDISFKISEGSKKWLIYVGIILGALLLVFGVFYFIFNEPQKDSVEIKANLPQIVELGKIYEIPITIVNQNSQNELKDVYLNLKVDEGVEIANNDLTSVLKSVSSIPANSSTTQIFKVKFWGRENEKRKIEISARYTQGNFDTRFEKILTLETTLGQIPFDFQINITDEILSDQSFNFQILVKNKSDQDFQQLFFNLVPVGGMEIISSEPQMENFKISLPLKGLEEKNIEIQAKIKGQGGEGKKIIANLIVPVRGNEIIVFQRERNISLIKKPLDLQIFTDNQNLDLNQRVNYTISYSNNSQLTLRSIIITADVSDPWFDLSTLTIENGGYLTPANKIIWNAGKNKDLAQADINEKGSVSFSVKIKKDFNNQKNNIVKVISSIDSTEIVPNLTGKIYNEASLENKIRGKLTITPSIYFKDPNNLFQNSGNYPPKVNQLNQYSLYLDIEASGNDFKNINLKTVLPGNVIFAGQIKGDTKDVNLVYNPRTNELEITIPEVAAFSKKTLVFQIEFTPSQDMIGKPGLLLETIDIKAQDSFTLENLNYTLNNSIDTNKLSDKNLPSHDGRITY